MPDPIVRRLATSVEIVVFELGSVCLVAVSDIGVDAEVNPQAVGNRADIFLLSSRENTYRLFT